MEGLGIRIRGSFASAVAAIVLAATPALGATTHYIAFGDSITAGVGDSSDRAQPGYPPRLQELLQAQGDDAVIENDGVGGEKTPQGLTRIDGVLANGGDVMLLMEGTNDISVGISEETTLFNLGQMAQRAADKGIETVQATLIPRKPLAPVDPNNILNAKIAEDIRQLAYSNGRHLVDPYQVFSTTPNVFSQDYIEVADDPVGHPNAHGYDLLAQTFADVLLGDDSVPPVPGPLTPENASEGVSSATPVTVVLFDFGTGIDASTVSMSVDGSLVSPTISGDAHRMQLDYHPAAPLSGLVTIAVHAADMSAPANVRDGEVSRFFVAGSSALTGDVNLDGRVDGQDLVLFALHFGASRHQMRYRSDLDFNSDGVIDGSDLAILAANFGQKTP
ncbi:MAG TPA: GDSL-type esterase/lipase family protein [Thermoanaerobaculia bacterium]|nr:GDSL-type esterase/lipase family protein [Thermoanaerobaculia bacterium]